MAFYGMAHGTHVGFGSLGQNGGFVEEQDKIPNVVY
jgi:hypothetical protein